jgi:hypothetical protein
MIRLLGYTTPLENILPPHLESIRLEQYLRLCKLNRPPVKFHKENLGKQKCCWQGIGSEFRYWVWEGDLWLCFVSNKQGICFEVKSDVTIEQAWSVWLDYLELMGVFR